MDAPARPSWKLDLAGQVAAAHAMQPRVGVLDVGDQKRSGVAVPGETVRPRSSRELGHHGEAAGVDDHHLAGAACRGEDQAPILCAEHAARLRATRDRAGVDERVAIDDFDGSLGGVRDEDPPAGQVDVGVVEAAASKGREAYEADQRQAHGYRRSATCFWHHA